MPIQSGDVRLVKSKVMLDTPEGGGGPTGIAIADGVSNDVFPDVSALDRVNGRVNARQVHLHVNTPTRDMYLGANMIVSRPPNDENISITLVDTGETFDTRADAISRVESYLFVGAAWPGALFGNHLAGMQVITLFQRAPAVPAIGDTLVLTKREGYSDEYRQYIRVTAVGVTEQEFEDNLGVYTRFVAEIQLSDPLRVDFGGFSDSRYDRTADELRLRTKVSKTVVANASNYYGVVELKNDAGIGDLSAKLDSIFTQLVPSAQVETPILDARTSQVSSTAVTAGGVTSDTRYMTVPWGPLNPKIFMGSGIQPGTLAIAFGGLNFYDNSEGVIQASGGGVPSGYVVGSIDYGNGILTWSIVDNFQLNPAVAMAVSYAPLAPVDAVTQNQGLPVTASNRSLNLVRTLLPVPVAGTLAIDYRAQGSWYTLQDNGKGELRGTDASFGAGVLNFSSGTFAVTFGALPDVGSAIIVRWVQPANEVASGALQVSNDGKLYFAFNSDGGEGKIAGRAIEPGTLTITWNDGSARSVTDNGTGRLSGYATGTVDYAEGWVMMSPTTLPPKGTVFQIAAGKRTPTSSTAAASSSGGTITLDAGGPLQPGSLSMTIAGQRKFSYKGGPVGNFGDATTYRLTDNGSGTVMISLAASYDAATSKSVGTVNYSTGLITINSNVSLSAGQAQAASAFDNMFLAVYKAPLFIVSGPSGG